MLLEILRHTPTWVFAVFAFLAWSGLKRLQGRVRDVRCCAIAPLIFIAWGILGLAHRSDTIPHAFAWWLVAAALGAAIGLAFEQPMQVDRERLLVRQPGSPWPLARNLLIFGAHYALNVAAALHPHWQERCMQWDLLVSGLSAGYFVGWSLRFVLTYRTAPAADLGDLRACNAAAGPARPSTPATTPRSMLMNRTRSTVLALAAALASVACTQPRAATLELTITGIRPAHGRLMIAVADSGDAWDDRAKPIASTTQAVTGARQVFRFDDLAPGTYAVKVMNDENGNGALDSNFMGMPTEGYGFSNNPKVLRKPTFTEAGFELGATGTAITIELR